MISHGGRLNHAAHFSLYSLKVRRLRQQNCGQTTIVIVWLLILPPWLLRQDRGLMLWQ